MSRRYFCWKCGQRLQRRLITPVVVAGFTCIAVAGIVVVHMGA